jgi:hypothetical protein
MVKTKTKLRLLRSLERALVKKMEYYRAYEDAKVAYVVALSLGKPLAKYAEVRSQLRTDWRAAIAEAKALSLELRTLEAIHG